MQSLCTKYWQLLLTQGILTGVGGGIFFTPCMGLLATWWSKRRALAMGIASTGNSAGGLVYPVIVRQLLPKIGFAWTVRTLGFVNLALLSVVIALMKPRLPPRKSGAIIDFAAFKEAPFALYTLALFFQVWCIYFTLYYVRLCLNQRVTRSLLTLCYIGNVVWRRSNRALLARLYCASHNHQRHWRARSSSPRLDCR